ncbi:hypothetical protein FHS93_001484 [Sphingobium francense]|nr:hypothetical protein [Sphingobium indicum]
MQSMVEGNGARPAYFPSTTRFASGPPPHASRREELMTNPDISGFVPAAWAISGSGPYPFVRWQSGAI